MRTKADNLSAGLKDKDVSPVLRLYFDLAHLKQVYRGQKKRGAGGTPFLVFSVAYALTIYRL